ncbi:hypothetical protein LTR05_001636 [Lithohypha guttulata]|uniref:Uncharacterized protein n=1 Tax=Lithohypha guttulata TaxID=1690604 RepID=A0AAN7T6N4_9EURO|nr:hypothetical protein LTR05_001636 [Lithohypha guttulata]
MGFDMVSVPLGYGFQPLENIIDDELITPGTALGELSGSRASTVTYPPRLTRSPVQDILDKERETHGKLRSDPEPIILLPKLSGMRFRWLEDIPAEIRCMVYSNLFSDATFRVHNHSSNACFAWDEALSPSDFLNQQAGLRRGSHRLPLNRSLRPTPMRPDVLLQPYYFPLQQASPTRKDDPSPLQRRRRTSTRQSHSLSTNWKHKLPHHVRDQYQLQHGKRSVKHVLRLFYRKHLFNQIKDLLPLFPTTTIRICALRKKQKDQRDLLPLEKEQCEMLCFQGKQCVVKVPVLAAGDQTESRDQLEVLDMPELEIVFDPAGGYRV